MQGVSVWNDAKCTRMSGQRRAKTVVDGSFARAASHQNKERREGQEGDYERGVQAIELVESHGVTSAPLTADSRIAA
jgi:hypothetical protein